MTTTNHELSQGEPLCNLIKQIQNQQNVCLQCGKSFKKISHFNRHMKQRHTQSRGYICSHQNCGKSFKRGSHLKRHMISHTNEKKFKCSQCIMSFGYKHHLDRHVKLIHLCERLECLQCGLEFKKKKAFNKHFQKIHVKKSQKSGEEQKFKDNCTVDRTNRDEIYESQSESQGALQRQQNDGQIDNLGEIKSQKMMFRCHHQSCLSAFHGFYEYKRHLLRIHSNLL